MTARSRIGDSELSHQAYPKSDELFATIYEQAQRVLGRTCGFYIVTYDTEADVARLAYLIDNDVVTMPDVVFSATQVDSIRQQRALVDDVFPHIIANGVKNSISVPMIRNHTVVGAFGAFTRDSRLYDQRDAAALEAIAELFALVLENARYVAEIQKARTEAERLEEIGRAISASLNISQVLQRVVDAARELLGAEAAAVWLQVEEDELEVAISAGELAPRVGQRLRVGMREVTGAGSALSVPLVANDSLLGRLSIGHKTPVRYRESDRRLLERLSFQAAIAVSNARLHEQLRALSLTDPLTEMPNRRHLAMFLEKEFAAARRGRKLSVLIFDLDRFKNYNDRKGHQAGDNVLRAFARVLVSQTRAMNLAARYGGDEFITILADTDRRGALAHGERIMAAVERDALLSNAGITASVGVATYETEMATFEDLIRAADRDLYTRKGARRYL